MKGVESAKMVVELSFVKCFCEERGLYSDRQNFENHGLSGGSTAVEMYGTVVLVIFQRLLRITATVAMTTVI